jgi:hypothetical protein
MGHIYWSCCVNATSLSRLALRAAPASKRTTVLPSEFGSIATLRLKITLGEKRRLIPLEAASMMVEDLAAEFSILAAQIKIDILMLDPPAGTRH